MKFLRRWTIDGSVGRNVQRRSAWDRIGVVDWPITRVLGLARDRRLPLAAANFLSRLGDGPIYLVIVVALALFRPPGTLLIILCAGVSIFLLHCVYPVIKTFTARPRPKDIETSFPESHPVLDEYSFPSGHVMTLTAALTPILYVNPRLWPVGLTAWAAMAWARLAIGHHFASDVVAGTLLGAAVAGGFTYLIVA